MAEELKDRKDMDPEYQWDLSKLYKDQEAWEKDLERAEALMNECGAFAGKLNNADNILAYLEKETELDRVISNIFAYASMKKSEDTRNPEALAMYSKAFGRYVQIMQVTSFAAPEILSLDSESLEKICSDPKLRDFSYNLVKLVRQKKHTLSAAEEKLLAGFSEVFDSPHQTYESLHDADMVFHKVRDKDGNEHELTGANYILFQSSDDRTLRENSFRSYYRSFYHHINTFASTYSGAVKAAVAEASARHYSSSREMFMADENIPASVYDGLIDSVRKHMPDMYRYVELRKKILGVDELHYYDIYAPLSKGLDKKYTYEDAKKMVLDAVAPLGSEYTGVVKQAFRDRWIDVYPNKGKQGGAYSEGTYDSLPYIMSNFVGDLESVSTIAHEMGHSMHTWFSNHAQLPQNSQYTIFVAEVASTVNENLLIEQLLQNETDPAERLALLNHYLEGFKGTVYRQTMFAEFEKQAHALAESGGAINAQSLNEIYGKLIKDYFGPELAHDDEVCLEWARIPHFYRPFYVYKYATSYSAAVAISENILKDPDYAGDYLNFLKLGGSEDPLDELKTAGVDLTTSAPVDRALDKFGKVLDEAFDLVEKMGI